MKNFDEKVNKGIIILGGNLSANDIAVGENASIIKTTKDTDSLSTSFNLTQKGASNKCKSIVKKYDVFISHASEDKEEVVRPLANALVIEGISVWYDEFELHIGDSLREKIDQGLANSRLGIVIISQGFIRKEWTNYELNGIVAQAITGNQILLPIWHRVTKDDVMKFSPTLADKIARNTSTHSTDEIVQEICELVKKK